MPEGARFSSPVQTGPGAHPASSSTMATGVFPGVKSGRVVTLIPHLLLVPWLRKGRAIPLLPLWALRPVQCLYKGALYLFVLPSDLPSGPFTSRVTTKFFYIFSCFPYPVHDLHIGFRGVRVLYTGWIHLALDKDQL